MEHKNTKGFYQNEYHDPSLAIYKLFYYSFLMFTLPFVAYFGTIYVMDEYFNILKEDSYIPAVVFAVVTVNLVLFAYVYEAFKENKIALKKYWFGSNTERDA